MVVISTLVLCVTKVLPILVDLIKLNILLLRINYCVAISLAITFISIIDESSQSVELKNHASTNIIYSEYNDSYFINEYDGDYRAWNIASISAETLKVVIWRFGEASPPIYTNKTGNIFILS